MLGVTGMLSTTGGQVVLTKKGPIIGYGVPPIRHWLGYKAVDEPPRSYPCTRYFFMVILLTHSLTTTAYTTTT